MILSNQRNEKYLKLGKKRDKVSFLIRAINLKDVYKYKKKSFNKRYLL